jgi:hypothetical protein
VILIVMRWNDPVGAVRASWRFFNRRSHHRDLA